MSDSLYRKLTEGVLDDDQVRALINWQLSRKEEDVDSQLIEECLMFLYPDATGIDPVRKAKMLDNFREMIETSAEHRRARQQHVHRRPRKALAIAMLLILMLALAVSAVAYWISRGVLNFNDDFGWGTPIVSQEGAEEFVRTGALAHKELEHVSIDVLEAAYDGAEMRIVYGVTSKVGQPYLPPDDDTIYTIPGAAEDQVHVCDYVIINDQRAFFYDTYETLEENQNQVLYYLQTNLKAWNIDVTGAETLNIELPLLGRAAYKQKPKTVAFTIPAEVPEGMVREAELIRGYAGEHEVSLVYAGFSPVCGYAELHFAGITKEEFNAKFFGMGDVVTADGEPLAGAHLEGNTREENDGVTIGFSVMPPADGWPDQLELIVFMHGESNWGARIKLN